MHSYAMCIHTKLIGFKSATSIFKLKKRGDMSYMYLYADFQLGLLITANSVRNINAEKSLQKSK